MANNNLPSNWSQYFDPSAFAGGGFTGGNAGGFDLSQLQPNPISNPNPIYGATSSLLGSGVASQLDPISGFISSLFGSGGAPSWKPYVDKSGNYVWANPKNYNPVPLTHVPGSALRPNKTYKQMAGNISALQALFPDFASIIAGQAIPQAQAAETAAAATAPGYEQIAKQQELAQGATDTQALQAASAPGGLIDTALAAQKQIDPEYYATRAASADAIQQLLAGIGPTVSREIGQGLAQSNAQAGTLNSPSQLNTVSNALQYGQAGRSALSQAVQAATTALPGFTSGMNAFQMTTGRSPVPNTTSGTAGLTNASALGSQLQGQLASAQQANNLNETNLQINKKDWADYLGQVTSAVGNLTSSAGSIAGIVCWIARRVYGENNPRWMLFRHYLFNKAPDKFKAFYLKYGEKLAAKLSDKDCDTLRPIMNNILERNAYV